MTKYILVRHGEPTYEEVEKLGFKGHGFDLAPLTENGILEVKETINDKIFGNSDILISSPYTRTMQTASIIANKYNLDINVEVLLHEWIPDLTGTYHTKEEMVRNLRIARKEYGLKLEEPNLSYSDDIEPLEEVKKRGIYVLEKYSNYNKVIVVTHGMVINMLTGEKLHTGDYALFTSEELDKIKKMR